MKEKVEEFACPNCGNKNYICWSIVEVEKTIPCLSCYREEWKVTVLREELDSETQIMVPVETETTLEKFGAKFICVNGTGRVFWRDCDTHVECEE
jgi:hypothetical protein